MIHTNLPLAKQTANFQTSIFFLLFSITSALVLVLMCGASAYGQESADISRALNVARITSPLTNDEKTTAVALAEDALRYAHLFSERRMYLTSAEIIRDNVLEMRGSFQRRVMLTYYRYEGDLSIHILIDLNRKRVLEVKQLPHFVAPISTQEMELAKQMALSHPQVSAAVEPYRDRLVIEALTLRATLPRDPLFQHRVVHLLFRSGSTYLMRQSRILVDLTSEKVIIEPAPRKPSM